MALVYIPGENRTKLDPKAFQGILVGYENYKSGYRIYSTLTKSISLSRDVRFREDEVTTQFAGENGSESEEEEELTYPEFATPDSRLTTTEIRTDAPDTLQIESQHVVRQPGELLDMADASSRSLGTANAGNIGSGGAAPKNRITNRTRADNLQRSGIESHNQGKLSSTNRSDVDSRGNRLNIPKSPSAGPTYRDSDSDHNSGPSQHFLIPQNIQISEILISEKPSPILESHAQDVQQAHIQDEKRDDPLNSPNKIMRDELRHDPNLVNDVENAEIGENELRRGTRPRTAPTYFNYNQLGGRDDHSRSNKGYLATAEDGMTYMDAMNSDDKDEWIKAINAELKSLHENQTWTTTALPKNAKAIGINGFSRKRPYPMAQLNLKHDW